jgi:hypothetical protein
MMVLNEELDWRTLSMDPDTTRGFRGTPVKVLLDPGKTLCRFITTESKMKGIPGNHTFKSSWWLDWASAMVEIKHWKTVKVMAKDVIRGRLAVTTQFNRELDSLVQIILTKPVYAWKGTAAHQDDTIRRVTYLGGGEQLLVPNLASDRDGLSSAVAYMHCFTSVESLK